MILLRTQIQNLLVTRARAGTFPLVSYDKDTRQASASDTSIAPSTALANETSSEFGTPVRNRRNHKFERGDWRFELRLEFNQEVALELFEESLTDDPPVLPADGTNNLRQVTLELVSAAPIEHPRQSAGSKGTRVTYELIARVSPI